MTNSLKTKFHKDGTITYWNIYLQNWVCKTNYINSRELASLSVEERTKVCEHLGIKTEKV